MAELKPTVLLVHGGWHTTEPYDKLLHLMQAKGYETVAPDLPSGADITPDEPAQADIQRIRQTAQGLIDSGKELLVVAHSYGGIVTAEALCGMGLAERKSKGLAGGVQSVVYVAAFILAGGQSLETMAPTKSVPWLDVKDGLKVVAPDVDGGPIFYPDLTEAEQQKWISRFTKHPIACSERVMQKTSYQEMDVGYVFCEQDHAVPFHIQRAMIDAQLQQGAAFKEATLGSGHFPMLSMPDVLVDVILQMAS